MAGSLRVGRTTSPSVSRFREDCAYTYTNLHSQAEAENEEVDQAGRRVLLAWLKFQKGLPEQESINIRDKPPTFALLSATVEAAQTSLEEKRASSTIKARFRKICSSINDYEDLAKVIPSNDKYVSIVTGAVGALIKVSLSDMENLACSHLTDRSRPQ